MNFFDTIKDKEFNDYLIFDNSEINEDKKIGNKTDDFEIIKLLGEGGFGQVYKVLSKLNNRIYVMKKINFYQPSRKKDELEKLKELFQNEVSQLKRLSHPNIVKYYVDFKEGNYLYIILEFINNGDIEKFLKFYTQMRPIPEEIVWKLFIQSISGLEYIHSMNIIYRDIKPANLLIDNNMTIKITDFGACAIFNNNLRQTHIGSELYMAPEIKYNSGHDQKVDIFSMGVTFLEICFSYLIKNESDIYKIKMKQKDNPYYSKELLEIFYSMIDDNKDKRPSAKEILDRIKNEYLKHYIKNSSLDSVIRCLYSFSPLTSYFLKIKNSKNNIIDSYIKCLEAINDKYVNTFIESINNFRLNLNKINPKLEVNKEIDPRYLFCFLIKLFHNEFNEPKISNNYLHNHYILFGKEIMKTKKSEMMFSFLNNFLIKFNSLISNSFMGTIKETKICNSCNHKNYMFKGYFLITFDLEKILKKNNIQKLNIEEAFEYKINDIITKENYCPKCLNITSHSFQKYFYFAPKLLVISFQRGASYQYKTPIIINPQLDITNYVEVKSNKYSLVGIIKRAIKNENEIYFSLILVGKNWIRCEEKKIKIINFPSNDDDEGDIIMLFYQLIE